MPEKNMVDNCIILQCIKNKQVKKDLPVDIVLSIRGNVKVYNQRHLLDINTSGLRRMETELLITRLLYAFSF